MRLERQQVLRTKIGQAVGVLSPGLDELIVVVVHEDGGQARHLFLHRDRRQVSAVGKVEHVWSPCEQLQHEWVISIRRLLKPIELPTAHRLLLQLISPGADEVPERLHERRVQRFYPAVPPPGETRPDFAITAALAKELGIELEGRSAAHVMDRIAASARVFEGVSFRKLAEVTEQWPLVGRGDLYYGGTSYENKQGLGVQLALATLTPISSPEQGKTLRPDEDQWLAVPVTRLYDRGITVLTSELLHQRIGGAIVFLHPDMAKTLAVEAGGQVELNGNRLEVRLDTGVPASVALVPRSMGVPIYAPVAAKLKKV